MMTIAALIFAISAGLGIFMAGFGVANYCDAQAKAIKERMHADYMKRRKENPET